MQIKDKIVKDTNRIFNGLSDYLEKIFPSKAHAIREVWKMDIDDLPSPIRELPDKRREAIIAGYAANIYLTIQKYPEQLAQDLLWLTECDPDKPHNSTSYAMSDESFFVGNDLPNWGYGYSAIEIRRKQINYGEKGKDHDKPLFIPISALQTSHMTEDLDYYRVFRGVLDMARRDKAA